MKDDTVVARLTSTLSPTFVNEFRFTFGRDFEFEFGQPAIPGEPVSQLGVSPGIGISGSAGITFGYPNFLDRAAYPDERNYQFADTLAWTHGKHLFKFGEDINRVHDLLSNLFQQFGVYNYNNRADFITDYTAYQMNNASPPLLCLSATTHVPCYNSFNQGLGPLAFKFTTVDYGLFAVDDWRASSRLTLNLGLRWDYQQLPSPQIPNALLPATNSFPSSKHNFGPRLGAAWDLTGRGKTVIRGGYGIYYGRIINSTISNAITNTAASGAQFQFQYQPGDAGAPLYPRVATTTGRANPPDVVVFAKDTPNPMIHEFDVVFEHQLATNMAVSVSYIGSLGRNLPLFIDANLPQPTGTITYHVKGGPDDGATHTVPQFTCTVTTPSAPCVRPNPNFGRITTISDIVSSKFNGIVIQFNRRMTKGLQIQAAYTYAQTSDNGQSSQTFTSSNNVLTPFDLGLEQGRSNFDLRHRFGASVIWQPGYFDNKGTLARLLLGGFTIAPTVGAASGGPYTGTVSGNAPNPSSLVKDLSTGILGAGGSSRPVWLPRNAFQMPRTASVDLRIAKKFPLYERLNLEVFGQSFNLFNHVNTTAVGTRIYSISGTFANPVLNYDTSFGVVQNSSSYFSNPRQIEIGARLTF